jgi:hypothetical protein
MFSSTGVLCWAITVELRESPRHRAVRVRATGVRVKGLPMERVLLILGILGLSK